MSLGRRGQEEQQELWVATTDLPKSEGHVFYRKLNELLAKQHLFCKFRFFVLSLEAPSRR